MHILIIYTLHNHYRLNSFHFLRFFCPFPPLSFKLASFLYQLHKINMKLIVCRFGFFFSPTLFTFINSHHLRSTPSYCRQFFQFVLLHQCFHPCRTNYPKSHSIISDNVSLLLPTTDLLNSHQLFQNRLISLQFMQLFLSSSK